MSAPRIDLKDVITTTVLSGLHYPRPPRELQVSIDAAPVGRLTEAAKASSNWGAWPARQRW